MTRDPQRRMLLHLICVACTLVLAPLAIAIADDSAVPDGSYGPLDGMDFVGMLGPAGRSGDQADTIHFRKGHFWSAICTKCGFTPGPYWVRFTDDGIHFRGELQSQESGKFFYAGVIRDERITVHINWRKDRWYWSIDRDFRFEGTLAHTSAASVTLQAARVAATAKPQAALECHPGTP